MSLKKKPYPGSAGLALQQEGLKRQVRTLHSLYTRLRKDYKKAKKTLKFYEHMAL